MNERYFWLLSDQKTVREISWEKWRELANKDWNRDNHVRTICSVSKSELYFRRGKASFWIPLRQLKEVLTE